jgi:hypothetical protein
MGREERLQIMLTPDELRAVDDWRFERRMPSRASAVRELLRRGLASEGFDSALSGVRSKDFGVTSEGQPSLDDVTELRPRVARAPSRR